ncbi:MAG: DUF533 domain-containing protein [Pseudomonadota bacterium]
MFDARSLIEMMMRGGGNQQGATAGRSPAGGGFEDLLRNLTGGQSGGSSSGGLGLDDLMRQINPGASSGGAASESGQNAPAGSGGLGDILGQLQKHLGGGAPAGDTASGQTGSSGGGMLDQLGDVFNQATDGVKDGAGKIGDQPAVRDMLEKLGGGRSAEDVMGQIQDFLARNKLGAGAALGGLGALVLGTRTGRSVAVNAAKIGALALIGGLAYKAYTNYSQGQSPSDVAPVEPEPAPSGSGFEESAVSDDAAITYLRAMIAAAASDGRLDAAEQQKITANLVGAGLDNQAEEFIAREINAPASIADLAAGVSNEREAMQVYMAARLAIDPDMQVEQNFLADLAHAVGIDNELRRHIDATANNMAS